MKLVPKVSHWISALAAGTLDFLSKIENIGFFAGFVVSSVTLLRRGDFECEEDMEAETCFFLGGKVVVGFEVEEG